MGGGRPLITGTETRAHFKFVLTTCRGDVPRKGNRRVVTVTVVLVAGPHTWPTQLPTQVQPHSVPSPQSRCGPLLRQFQKVRTAVLPRVA